MSSSAIACPACGESDHAAFGNHALRENLAGGSHYCRGCQNATMINPQTGNRQARGAAMRFCSVCEKWPALNREPLSNELLCEECFLLVGQGR